MYPNTLPQSPVPTTTVSFTAMILLCPSLMRRTVMLTCLKTHLTTHLQVRSLTALLVFDGLVLPPWAAPPLVLRRPSLGGSDSSADSFHSTVESLDPFDDVSDATAVPDALTVILCSLHCSWHPCTHTICTCQQCSRWNRGW